MSNFAQLIQNQKTNLSKLQEENEATGSGGGAPKDPRKWKHTADKTTYVGTSLIRFLPRYDENGEVQLPWVSWTEFNFKNKANKSYWNRNLADIGELDPVGELNKAHWGSIPEAEKKDGIEAKKARLRNVKQKFVANIVVLEDPANPEAVGKVFLYEFGPSVKKILEKALFPKFEHITPIHFYDFMNGANFRIQTFKDSKGWYNYDEYSTLEAPSPLANGDMAVLEGLYNSCHDLSEFTDKSNYKTYDELKKDLLQVVGGAEYSRIMGVDFNPEQLAEAGANPFPQAGANAEQTEQQAQSNTEQQQQATGGNPFPQAQANAQSAESKPNPFPTNSAGTQVTGAETESQPDPFKNATKSDDSGAPNPFAGLNVAK